MRPRLRGLQTMRNRSRVTPGWVISYGNCGHYPTALDLPGERSSRHAIAAGNQAERTLLAKPVTLREQAQHDINGRGYCEPRAATKARAVASSSAATIDSRSSPKPTKAPSSEAQMENDRESGSLTS